MKIENQKLIEKYLKKHPAAAEYRFLFDCCRAAFAGTKAPYPAEIRRDVFLGIVQRHKLVTHLYPILKSHCENVPEAVLTRFQQLLKLHNLHILKLSGELARLSKSFAAHDIPWLSIKGPALSVQLYGDVAMRPSGDLDILVNKEDIDKAVDLICEAGYRPKIDHSKFNKKQVNFIRNYYKDIAFRHQDSNIHIELHWLIDNDRKALLNKGLFNTDNISVTQIGNHQIPTFSTEFNQLYLCMHGSHHLWNRLFWLWDFAVIIKNLTAEQADRLIERFKKHKLEPALGQTVALVKNLFSMQLTGSLDQIPAPERITALAYRFMLAQNMMSLRNSPFRVYYKLKTFTFSFFFSYYFRRIITFILRKYTACRNTRPCASTTHATHGRLP